jgi:hypothetical protein
MRQIGFRQDHRHALLLERPDSRSQNTPDPNAVQYNDRYSAS